MSTRDDRYAAARGELSHRTHVLGRRPKPLLWRGWGGYAIVLLIAVGGSSLGFWILSAPIARAYVAISAGVATAIFALRMPWLARMFDHDAEP